MDCTGRVTADGPVPGFPEIEEPLLQVALAPTNQQMEWPNSSLAIIQ